MTERERILSELKELIARAKEGNLVLVSTYDPGIVMLPEELEAANARGSFIWGTVNWRLASIDHIVQGLIADIANAQKKLDTFVARVKVAHDAR